MAGGSILQRVDENLTYDYLHSSEDNLWSLLYLTGYLTKAQTTIDTDELPPGMMELKIPNAEIKERSLRQRWSAGLMKVQKPGTGKHCLMPSEW